MSETLPPTGGPSDGTEAAPPVDAARPAPRGLHRVRRTLRFAVADEGSRLWDLRWLERTCRPLLLRIGEDAARPEVDQAAAALEGVDGMPWTERLEPVQKALEAVEAALAALPEDEPTIVAQGELVSLPETPVAEPRRGSGRRARRSQKRQEVKPPPPPPRHALGAPGHTGQPLASLGGVSGALVSRFGELGVKTVADLLRVMPATQTVVELTEGDLPEEGTVALEGEILARWSRFGPSGRIDELDLSRAGAVVRCRWVGPMPPDLRGGKVTLVGRLERVDDAPVLYEAQRFHSDGRGGVRIPGYGLDGLDDGDVSRLVRFALSAYADQLLDPFPPALVQRARVLALSASLWEQHVPSSSQTRGRERRAFEELLFFQLAVASSQKIRHRGLPHPISHSLVARLQHQGLVLNDAQELVFDEIRRDLRKTTAMTRLLQGDVGSGKALVAMLTGVLVAESKAQVCFLAPDGISAAHRYQFAEPTLRSLGIVPQLISGPASPAQLDALRRGEATCVFATHELAKTGLPEFKKLGLVIVEERSNFGVLDRNELAQKGVQPDLLVVTSVPIPASLAFTIFSDHDISVLHDSERQIVQAQLRQPDERDAAYAQVRDELEAGRQAYVCFPLLAGKDLLPLDRARQLGAALGAEAFPGKRLALYHGGMSREEQHRVFEDFQHRRVDVLVATTTIEDAPEVANATVMHVENADRYDLVRLHRLRGHVARGRTPGICNFVLSNKPADEGRRLVELLVREQDGFAVSEQDRLARGDDALLGNRVADMPTFEVADTARDRKVLLRARRAALSILLADPELRQRNHRAIALRLRELHPDLAKSIETPDRKGRGRRRRRRKKGGS
ncbi:MAG: hypothetical protein GY913_24965 [Proteobacteria bacterium]|nr:hypothetical protein [Pseudomonadota bacterium]MCP4920166.1 hypothetical protein [Pseudomonadota bacterium]